MIEDPIVEEVHRIREAIAARFNNDLRAIWEDAKKRQDASGREVISLPPRLVKPTPAPEKKVG